MHHLRFVAAFLFILLANLAFGQSYKTAVGIRVDNGINLTLQQYIADNWTGEAIVHTSFASSNLGLSVLAEKHQKLLFRGLNIYGGFGGHYYWKGEANNQENEVVNNVFGLSVIGGAEIDLGRLNIAVDWKPELHLSGDQVHPFDAHGYSVSVRYILAKRERKKISDWKVWDSFGKKKNTNSKKRR